MEEHNHLAERFERHRTHLRAVAYQMLDSLSEADGDVQKSWLRISRAGTSGAANLGRWPSGLAAFLRSVPTLQRSSAARSQPARVAPAS